MYILIVIILLFNFSAPVLATAAPDITQVNDTSFRFTDLGWSSDPDDYFEYVPDEGRFKRGTTAYGYMEVGGFENYYDGESYYIDLTVDVYLKSSFGLRLFAQYDVIEFQDSYRQPQETVWFYIYVDIPRWAPRATYVAEVVVRDRLSEIDLVHEERLTVE